MHLTIVLEDDRVVPVDVDGGETIQTVKAIIEAETGIAASEQLLSFSGKGLTDSATLAGSSVKDGDLLMLAHKGAGADAAQSHAMATRQDGTPVDAAAMTQALRSNPDIMEQVRTGNPALHSALRDNDVAKVAQLMQEMHRLRADEAARQRQAEADLWNADPFDPEAQAAIERRIQDEHIAHNYEQAMEHNPEVFVHVDMLYVNLEINKHIVAAFVDSGAQMTIVGNSTAQRLGLMHLVDRRFAGIAKGVGSGKIVGRIHQAMMKVGNEYLATQLTVMDNNDMPFLFGLDMLRRHQCQIDLRENVLRFTNLDMALPFLQPHELPDSAQGALLQSASAAANQSGKPAASSSAAASSAAAGASGTAGASNAAVAAGAAAAARAAAGAPMPATAAPTADPAAAASAPPPQQAPPAAAAAAQSQAARGDATKVQQLVQLGFTQQQAAEALAVCEGDTDRAAAFLFESSMGF